jgi:hypothetical protein
MSNNKAKSKGSQPIIKKIIKNTANVGEKLPVVLVKENRLNDYLRVFSGSPNGVSREFVLHHPIGITDLAVDDWVMSEPSDVPLLLSRAKDPNGQRIADAKAKWLTEKAIIANILRREGDGNIHYAVEDSSTRKEFFEELQLEFAKKQKADKTKNKFDLNTELDASDDPRAAKEAELRTLYAGLKTAVDARFASTYRTCGGSRGDHPQEALEWAKGLTLPVISDMLILHGTNGPQKKPAPVASAAIESSNKSVPDSISTYSKQHGQWCFIDNSIPADKRDNMKKTLRTLRENLKAVMKKDYTFTIAEASAQV